MYYAYLKVKRQSQLTGIFKFHILLLSLSVTECKISSNSSKEFRNLKQRQTNTEDRLGYQSCLDFSERLNKSCYSLFGDTTETFTHEILWKSSDRIPWII